MVITPQTDIRLLKVPIEIDNKNQLTFANRDAQETYFLSLPHLLVDDSSYQRKDEYISYPAHIDKIIEYNYCMYRNDNYSNKWFYAFITGMKYENDGMTNITISTDFFQTWQFDITWKQSFIEREMVSVASDIPGSNRLPESFELGEMKVANSENISELDPAVIVVFSGDKISGDGTIIPEMTVPQYSRINGIPNAVGFVLSTINGISLLLGAINLDGNGDKIVSVFTIPKLAVNSIMPSDTPSSGNYPFVPISGAQLESALTKTLSLTRPNSLDNYTPRNKKLLQYPFCYLGFNPQNGSQKIYRFEDFSGSPSFDIISEVNPNPEVRFIPNNYRGVVGQNIGDSVILNGYPTLSYSNDVFNSWLAKNSDIISLNMQQEQLGFMLDATSQLLKPLFGTLGMGGKEKEKDKTSLLSKAGDFASGGLDTAMGLIGSTINHDYYVKNQVAQVEKQQLMPNQVSQGSSNATMVGYGLIGSQLFTTYNIRQEFAERIDKFFDMYGYLTNTLKIPNLNNRPNWNYVKTIGANIIGSIPQLDLEAIKNMFNNGVTLWHNPLTFLDYSQNNRT